MNLSVPEILVLAVLGLLIFGPERLPEIARKAGKAIRAFQDETSKAMSELRAATSVDGLERGTDAGVFDRPHSPPATDGRLAPGNALSPQPPPAARAPEQRVFEDT